MGYFTKYRSHYITPERYTPSVARARRLNALLEQERRFADLPNFNNRLAALSQAEKINTALSLVNVNDRKASGHKAALIAAALSQFKEKDFSNPIMRENYRKLRQAQEAARVLSARREGWKKVSVPGGDKRHYNPTGKSFAATTSGNIARLMTPYSSAWRQVFKNPGSVIPCVQRQIRRQVMFAKGRAGVGYKVKHRKTWATGVPC